MTIQKPLSEKMNGFAKKAWNAACVLLVPTGAVLTYSALMGQNPGDILHSVVPSFLEQPISLLFMSTRAVGNFALAAAAVSKALSYPVSLYENYEIKPKNP